MSHSWLHRPTCHNKGTVAVPQIRCHRSSDRRQSAGVCAGMMAGVPHGHMIPVGPHAPGMPPQMMPTIMMQPQPHQHHVAAAPSGAPEQPRPVAAWPPQAVPVAAAVPTPQPAAPAPTPSGAQKERADTNRTHSGWTPMGTKKLPGSCMKQRIPRKCAPPVLPARLSCSPASCLFAELHVGMMAACDNALWPKGTADAIGYC